MINKSLERIEDFISSSKFMYICPTASKTLSYAKKYYRAILRIADQCNIYTSSTDEIYFSMSVNQLANEYSKINGFTNHRTINQNINLLTYHKLITKIDDKNAPKRILNDVLKYKRKVKNNDKLMHVQIYSITPFTKKHLNEIETRAQLWVENKYSVNSLTYETLFRCDGDKIAWEVYPQLKHVPGGKDKTRVPGVGADNRFLRISDYILTEIQDKGYCLASSVPEAMGYSKVYVNKYIPAVLKTYDLSKVAVTKEIKELLNIKTNGYPNIYIKMSNETETET